MTNHFTKYLIDANLITEKDIVSFDGGVKINNWLFVLDCPEDHWVKFIIISDKNDSTGKNNYDEIFSWFSTLIKRGSVSVIRTKNSISVTDFEGIKFLSLNHKQIIKESSWFSVKFSSKAI